MDETTILSIAATTGSNLPNVPVKNGQMIFVHDKHKLAFDLDDKRVIYKEIIELATEASRTSLLAPISGCYYFVVETALLWAYRDGEWIQIGGNGGSGGSSGALQVVTTAGSSTAYTATVDGIDALTVGAHFVMIPHVTSGKTAPKLNVNSLGEKTLRMVNPNNSYNTATPSNADWLRAGTPVLVMYNGTYWVTVGLPYISAESFNGVLPVSKGGTGVKTLEEFVTNLGLDSSGGGEDGLCIYGAKGSTFVCEPTITLAVDQIEIPEGKTVQVGDLLLVSATDSMCLYSVDSITGDEVSAHSVSYLIAPSGADGQNGSRIHKVNSNPTSYTAGINGIATKCRFALSTVLSQSGSDVIRVDDLLLQNSNFYFVCYVDDTYVYCDANVSVKGATGADGADGKDGVSATHSWSGTTLTMTSASGTSSADLKGNTGDTGATGERGTGILKITTAPSSYTTATGGFTPTYRVALSTVLSQSKASKVLVGDTVAYNYYQYPVGYVDASYVYLGARTSIRGSTGAAGTTPVKGTDYYTDADKTEMVTAVKAAMPTFTLTGIDVNDVEHTWTLYGVQS